MKFRIVLTIVFFLMLIMLGACSETERNEKVGVVLMLDVTDNCDSRKLVTHEGLTLLLDSDQISDGAKVWVTDITGSDLRPIKPFEISPKSSFENPENRDKEVAHFLNTVHLAVQDTSSGCYARTHSSIYKPLARMVNLLREDTSLNKRIIVLLSDGMEHTAEFSFLKDKGFNDDPSATITRLEEVYGPFPDLTDFEILLVHQPDEKKGANIKALEFWQLLFQSQNAEKVSLKATL